MDELPRCSIETATAAMLQFVTGDVTTHAGGITAD